MSYPDSKVNVMNMAQVTRCLSVALALLLVILKGGVAWADITFTIDPSQTGLPEGYQYCVYSNRFGLTKSDGNYTVAQGANSGSCQPVSATSPLTSITIPTGSLGTDVPDASTIYIVAVDTAHTLADVANPANAAFGVPIQGYPSSSSYNPPFAELEMSPSSGNKTLDLDVTSIDWLGMPVTMSLTNNPYCTTSTGTGSNTPFSTNGLCNMAGNTLKLAMSDIVTQALATEGTVGDISGLVFNLDAVQASTSETPSYYQSVMGIQDYLVQKSDGLHYKNLTSPLQDYMDAVVAGLFSPTNTNIYYLQGAASADGHTPTVSADVYKCQYSTNSIPLYGNNAGFAAAGATINSYIECAPQINTSSPSYQIYDPRQVALLRVDATGNGKTSIQGTWSASDPCEAAGCTSPHTITWTFSPTTTVPIKVPNGGGWNISRGNWISGPQGSFKVDSVNATDKGNINSVTIEPQRCTQSQLPTNTNYFCPNPDTSLQSMGFFQANPVQLAFGSSITHSIFAGTGTAIDNVYQYKNQLGYSDVLGSLEDQFNEAMNRGVFDNAGNVPSGCELQYQSNTPQGVTTACFGNNDYWYPAQSVRTSNPWAQFIHTGTNTAKTPFFVQQTLYNGSSPLPNMGNVGMTKLGMSYAFQMDENPIAASLNFTTPNYYQPYQVPAEWSALADGTTIKVTLNPWKSSTPQTSNFTVSGTISGLKGAAMVTLSLQTGSSQAVVIEANANYTFPSLGSGAYTLSLSNVPDGVTCTFANGLSQIPLSLGPSTTQDVTCLKTGGYHVGGTVSGLDATKQLTLLNNGVDLLEIGNPSNNYPSFEFNHRVASTSGYAVTVKTNPPGQTCTVTQNGSGKPANHKGHRQVGIACVDNPAAWSVGGSVQGLAAHESLSLTLNGQNQPNPIAGSGIGTNPILFTLRPELPNGLPYTVSVAQGGNPAGKTCTVANGSGVIQSQDVTTVSVICVDNPSTFKVWGNVTGLGSGDQVIIWNKDNSSQYTVTWPNSSYAFDGLANGSPYSLYIASSTQTCSFSGSPAGVIAGNNVEADISCTASNGTPLSVQNQGPTPAFLLGKTQAAVVELNGGLDTKVVWGGSTTPTQIGKFSSGFVYNVQIIGQSINQSCADSYITPGVLGASTVLPFYCGNAPGNITPGVCNGTYNNQYPPLDIQQLCDQGYTSGPAQLPDGRYRWHCSGLGNPKINPPGGTQTCYSLSKSEPSKKNQAPLVLNSNSWTITSGTAGRNFTVVGGSGTGAVVISNVQSVGHANCSLATHLKSGWIISSTATRGTNGSGACVVWASQAGDAQYFSVDSSPTVFNVKPKLQSIQ